MEQIIPAMSIIVGSTIMIQRDVSEIEKESMEDFNHNTPLNLSNNKPYLVYNHVIVCDHVDDREPKEEWNKDDKEASLIGAELLLIVNDVGEFMYVDMYDCTIFNAMLNIKDGERN